MSQVPGGLGVFESVIVLFLSPQIPGSKVITSLLLYRTIYYILPLAIAAMMLAVNEGIDRWAQVKGFTRMVGRWIPEIVRLFLTIAAFLGGVVLMVSGATPGVPGRLAWLRVLVPLPLLEISHFLATLVGAALLVVARGLERRLDAAYHATAALLLGGILFSLLKGFDYEEAGVPAIILALLIPSRRHFYRKASLLAGRFSPGWIAAVALVLSGSLWLTLFSYEHAVYSNTLLWQFAFTGDAPRSLRGIVGVTAALVVLGVHSLFQTAPPPLSSPGPTELDGARGAISFSRDTSAYLALLGDKNLLFSETGESFIMYAVEGKSWVAMRDPVGPESEVTDLLWRFVEMCNRNDGWPVFYEVGSNHLPLYLDLGLVPLKIGEEARVSLPEFTIDGGRRRGLRHTIRKIEREGSVFSIVPPSECLHFCQSSGMSPTRGSEGSSILGRGMPLPRGGLRRTQQIRPEEDGLA